MIPRNPMSSADVLANGRAPIQVPVYESRDPLPSDSQLPDYPVRKFWWNYTTQDLWILSTQSNATGTLLSDWVKIGGAASVFSLSDQVGNFVFPAGNNIQEIGVIVPNATNPSGIPLETVADDPNDVMRFQIQLTAAFNVSDVNNAGIASFNLAHFTVDANGYVSLAGGGTAFDSATPDVGAPAVADVNGNINLVGQLAPNVVSTSGIQTFTDVGSPNSMGFHMFSPFRLSDFAFQNNISETGTTRSLSVEHTSNTANSQARFNVQVAGTTAGDAWTQWTVGTTRSYAEGIDNSDSQKFKFTTAASATVNPSTAPALYSFTPGTGFNYLNDGTNSFGIGIGINPISNYSLSILNNGNQFNGSQIANQTVGTASVAGTNYVSDTISGSIGAFSSTFPTFANQFGLSAGAIFSSAAGTSGTIRDYVNTALIQETALRDDANGAHGGMYLGNKNASTSSNYNSINSFNINVNHANANYSANAAGNTGTIYTLSNYSVWKWFAFSAGDMTYRCEATVITGNAVGNVQNISTSNLTFSLSGLGVVLNNGGGANKTDLIVTGIRIY